MKKFYTLLICFFPFFNCITAQPSNDDCSNARPINSITNWCSNAGAFTNEGATPSGFSAPDCFSGAHNDVWFSFVARATDVSIAVIGRTRTSPGGTLSGPELTLYTGDCSGSLSEWRCGTDTEGDNTGELIRGGLIVGATYLIRVQGRNGATGTFQLCIDNYNPPFEPGSDCFVASVLCDKSSFSVRQLKGGGNNPNEARGTCLDIEGNSESSSTWFVWEALTNGPLTFTLTPLRASDDLDFVLFEMPGGFDDCSNLRPLRCMATACTGPTGLNMTSTDTSEDANCDRGEDGFVRFIDMVAGKKYALLINNFSDTGDGFNIEFGNDPTEGEFLGPEAEFVNDEPDSQVCVGDDVAFSDASSFPIGSITNWSWTFGVGAEPQVATGPGPHEVVYENSGIKSVVLIIETNLGCKLTKIANFTVLDDMIVDAVLTKPDCGGGTNGAIEVAVSNGFDPLEYSWEGGDFLPMNARLENLSEGSYTLVVRDAQGCLKEEIIGLSEKELSLDLTMDPFTLPTCNGDQDASLVINVVDGIAPYQYDFGNGLGNSNVLGNIGAGTYNVFVLDSKGCERNFSIVVEDPPVMLLDVDPKNISCNGLEDGNAMAIASGGRGGYIFNWSNGATGPFVENLAPGNYEVAVIDSGGCELTQSFTIQDLPPLNLDLLGVTDLTCFGEPTGVISMMASGGNPPFEYALDGINFQSSNTFTGLLSGLYDITTRDASGCTEQFLDIFVDQAPPLTVDAGENQTVDLGQPIQLQAFTPDIGVEFFWSGPDSLVSDNRANVQAWPFNSGNYIIRITNNDNCTALDSMSVTVINAFKVFAPNIFSPNGDGINDGFTLYGGFSVRRIKSLKVFDRWGDLVFATMDIPANEDRFGWDGTFKNQRMASSVFAYVAEVEFLDGQTTIISGDVALLR